MNISKRGAKLAAVGMMMEDFHGTHPAANDVEKVIIAVGCNDLKHESYGLSPRHSSRQRLLAAAQQKVKRFREPLVNIVKQAKHLFPSASIFLQCVLPMQRKYWYTVENVLGFNDILKDVCRAYDCYYLDCFHRFLSLDGRNPNHLLFNDWLHPNRWGKNILSSWYSYVVNESTNMMSMIVNRI